MLYKSNILLIFPQLTKILNISKPKRKIPKYQSNLWETYNKKYVNVMIINY